MKTKIKFQPRFKNVLITASIFVSFWSAISAANLNSLACLYETETAEAVFISKTQPGEDDYPSCYLWNVKSDEVNFESSGEIKRDIQDIVSMDLEIPVKNFKAAVVDKDNNKWFLTEAGLVSFDGKKWTLHNKNTKVATQNINGIAFEDNPHGQEIWLATRNGATVATLPVDALTGATTYHDSNTVILSNNVKQVAVGNNPLRWFGTDKGVSAFKDKKWLTPDYEEFYPEFVFQEFPVLSMATGTMGDTLYVGTNGAGIARVFSNDVDGISGASVLAQWGPMILPSDKIYSIFVAQDNTKWFGTDMGLAKHVGQNSLENWTAYTTEDGLINNFIQAITADKNGNTWIGTKGGISVLNGTEWKSFTENDGLVSNNVLCIVIDNNGVVWIGTDKGVSSFENGTFTNYK
jgi:ligand-binding sensor domain-containing protein